MLGRKIGNFIYTKQRYHNIHKEKAFKHKKKGSGKGQGKIKKG